MKTTINKLRTELETLANASEMINGFFWKDLLRAQSENVCQYPLMTVHYTVGGVVKNQTRIQLEINICDKIDKDWNFNLDDVESDTLNIQRQIFNAMQSVRWKKLGRIESATVRKFIAESKDYVAGHTMTLTFLLRDTDGVCDLPIFDYDFDSVQTDEGTVTVFNSDSSYSVVVDCGDSLQLPDITYAIENSLGTVLSSAIVPSVNNITDVLPDVVNIDTDGTPTPTPLGVPFVCSAGADGFAVNSDLTYSLNVPSGTTQTIADSSLNVNSTPEGSVVSAKTIDINVSDGVSPVVPDAVSIVGNTISIQVPASGASISTATLMKTGQTTSFRTDDDGDLESGRETDFLTLAENNPFGDTNRFTDELGGSTYTNDIVIDWSTYNGSNVLGYYRIMNVTYLSWNDAIDGAAAHTIGTFTTGWRLWNRHECENLLYHGVASSTYLNYTPFNLSTNLNVWTATTAALATTSAFMLASSGNGNIGATAKTAVAGRWIASRVFTVTGTTLT